MADRQKVIDIALSEVGYIEKRDSHELDSKTGNAGSSNWTKYARDLDAIPGFYNGPKNGYAWCDVFVDWCFNRAYGPQEAKRLLCQPDYSAGAGCTYSAAYYQQHGQLHHRPQPGDQIFFGNARESTHTGIVYKVDESFVYTVEGNTSTSSGVVPNGGAVCKKRYPILSRSIYAYGRPDYDGTSPNPHPEAAKPKPSPTYYYNVRLGLLKEGMFDKQVEQAQTLLNAADYDCGEPDGEMGKKTVEAVKSFQREHRLLADGEIGGETWTALLGGR